MSPPSTSGEVERRAEEEEQSIRSVLDELLCKHTVLEDSLQRIEKLLDSGQRTPQPQLVRDEEGASPRTLESDPDDDGDNYRGVPPTPAPTNVDFELEKLENQETNMVSHVGWASVPSWFWNPSSLVKYATFERAVAVAIFLNSVTIGIQIDLELRGQVEELEYDVLGFVNWGCIVLFLAELAVRIWHSGRRFLAFTNNDFGWNLFDLITVVSSAIELVVVVVAKSNLLQVSLLRVLRILRLVKVARPVRILPFFRELRVMIHGVLRCAKSLLWAVILYTLTTYVYAILLAQSCTKGTTVVEQLDDGIDCSREFDSLPELLYILFKCTTGGLSWGDFADTLIDTSPMLVLGFCFYIVVFMFVIINVITAVFVESALTESNDPEEAALTEVSRRKRWLQKVVDMFKKYDFDNTGKLDINTVLDMMISSSSGRADLKSLGIDVVFGDSNTLRRILDKDGDGIVSLHEFADGLASLTSPSRAADVILVRREVRKLGQDILEVKHRRTSCDS